MSSRSSLDGLLDALIDGWAFDLDAGESIKVIPSAHDRGFAQVGNGTKDMDVKVFLGAVSQYVLFDVGNAKLDLVGVTLAIDGVQSFTGSGGPRMKVSAVAANTTLSATQLNGYITNRGATGAVTIILPNAATAGDWFEYWGVADQDITFSSETADTLLAGLNDAAADSLAFSTAGNKIGARATGFYDGTQWHIHAHQGTATIVTA